MRVSEARGSGLRGPPPGPGWAAVAAAGAVVAMGIFAWPYTVDDAYIIGRYARNLVAGEGYVFNPAEGASDGVTGPAWLAPLLLAASVGADPIAVAKVVGIACMATAAAVWVARIRRRAGGRAAAWLAALIVALSPSLGTWGGAGLETGAAALAFALGARAALRRPVPSAALAGVCVGALAWLRPEMVFAGAVLVAVLAGRRPRAGVRAVLVAGALVLGVAGFRLLVFGDVLPLSVAAKPAQLGHGLRYAGIGVLLATSGFGVVACGLAARAGRADDRVLAAVLCAHGVAIVLAGGDWMPGMRLWVPVLPAYAALAAVGVERVARVAGARRGRLFATVLVVTSCVVPTFDLAVRVPELHAAGRARDRVGAEVAGWLQKHARRVALVDVGYLGYASGVEVIDLGGLTDARVARLAGGHLDKRIPPEALRARAPDALVLHSRTPPRVDAARRLVAFDGFPVERRVARMPWVRESFRVERTFAYAPAYHYVLLTRQVSNR